MRADPPWSLVEHECDRLLAALRASATSQPQEIPTHHVYILGMYWRCVRLFAATLLLLKAELPEEAAIIARSLFEESLRLQQLAADESNRDALILGWANASINERSGLLMLARSLGLNDDIDEGQARMSQERRSLQAYQQRLAVKKLRRFGGERDAALRFGRQDDHWTYELAHEFVHGSDAAWMFGRRPLGPGMAALHAKTNDAGIRAGFAEFAASSATAAGVAPASIFDWLKADSLAAPLAMIRELLSPSAG